MFTSNSKSSRTQLATSLATSVQSNGLRSLALYDILDQLTTASKSKDVLAREGAITAAEELFRKLGPQGGSDPYFVPLLPIILDRYQESGKTASIQVAAEKAAKQLVRLCPPELAPKVIEELFNVIEDSTAKWRSKVGALELLQTFATTAKDQVAERLGEYVPRLSGAMRDTKSEVSFWSLSRRRRRRRRARVATTSFHMLTYDTLPPAQISTTAEKTGITLCHVLTNPDIQPFVPDLVKCMADPGTVPAAIKRLSSTVWVREVDGPTLAVVAPLLTRALGERGTIVQRQTVSFSWVLHSHIPLLLPRSLAPSLALPLTRASLPLSLPTRDHQFTLALQYQVVLITNLFKLVRSEDLAALHAPAVLPGIERIIESAAFPEIRAFAVSAKEAVQTASEGAAVPAVDHLSEAVNDAKVVEKELVELVKKHSEGAEVDDFFKKSIAYSAYAVSQLVRKRDFDDKQWKGTYVSNYLNKFIDPDQADQVALELKKIWMAVDKVCFPRIRECSTADSVRLFISLSLSHL